MHYSLRVSRREQERIPLLLRSAGAFICNDHGALTGEISDNIIGFQGNPTRSRKENP